jgi:hypothetical protein
VECGRNFLPSAMGSARMHTPFRRSSSGIDADTAQAAAITGPAIVGRGVQAENDHRPEPAPTSRIVTARSSPRKKFSDAPDLTPEEHQRRGDAANALFRELVRQATGEKS